MLIRNGPSFEHSLIHTKVNDMTLLISYIHAQREKSSFFEVFPNMHQLDINYNPLMSIYGLLATNPHLSG
jgi:hypothetical protein